MITLLLIQKIASLFLIIIAGAILVKSKLLKSSDSRVISLLCLYLLSPCAIIGAFQVELSSSVVHGFLLALVAATIIQSLLIIALEIIDRIFHIDVVSKVSIVYSNCGNLIIPLVAGTLGAEWVIYSMPFMCVQGALMWSHGRSCMEGVSRFSFRRVFLNINMVSIAAGLVIFALGIRFPAPIQMAVSSMGDFLGPGAMLVAGMLIGSLRLTDVVKNPKVWIVSAIRLLAVPALFCLVLKFIAGLSLMPNAEPILLIVLLATAAPSASTMVNMAQVYDRDAGYATSINVVTLLGCIATMPLMTALFYL